MTSDLFRKEALEHRKDRLYGDVVLLQPFSMTILVSAAVVICLLVLAILFWGTYARKETVHGYLLPDKGIVKTYPTQAGTISKIFVREGDEVKEGQPLITILSERSMQGGSDIDTLQLQEIEATLAHQYDRIKSDNSLQTAKAGQLKSQIDGLKKELGQIEQNLKTQQERLAILQSRVDNGKKLLDNKNLSQLDYQKLVEDLLNHKQHYQDLLSKKASNQNTLAQTISELEQLPIKSKSSIHEIENNISELKQRQAEIKGRRGIELRAPISGTVTAVQAREGQVANNNNVPLLAIIPKDAVMQAELFVPSRAIGFITQGQTVRIRFDAFPYQRFGIYEGQVAVISKHVLLPQELPIPFPDLKEPVYRITVNLKKQYVMAYGKQFPLQAGMSLDADIILEKQTLFRWILDPLISLKGRI